MKLLKAMAWTALGLLGAALLFWVVSRGVVAARGRSGANARTRYDQLLKQRDRLQAELDQLKAWRSVPQALDEFRRRTIPAFDRFPAFRDDLQHRISESGLTTLKLTYRMRPVSQNLQRVTLEMSLSGPYAAIKRFMYGIENQREMVFLKSAQLRSRDSGVIAVFSMEAYFAR